MISIFFLSFILALSFILQSYCPFIVLELVGPLYRILCQLASVVDPIRNTVAFNTKFQKVFFLFFYTSYTAHKNCLTKQLIDLN